MTMPLPVAYQQNKNGWLANTRCANATDVYTCIQALSVDDVVSALPPLWDPSSYFPQTPTGNNFPGLVVIDGVTLTATLPDALSSGLVDVPLILTTMRDV